MRILVIGASGLVGSHIHRAARMDGHEVHGTFRHHPDQELVALDLGDSQAMGALLETYRPDWVVHAAGWTWVDGCEGDPSRAMEENCHQPARLARACQSRGIRLTYLSTTYVFDGTRGPYRESDEPGPINCYGRSKWEGERAVLAATAGSALVLRTICVWGVEKQRKNFAYQAIRALLAGEKMSLPSDQWGNPTWAGDIAAWALALMAAGRSGIWNVASPWAEIGRIDWFCSIGEKLRATGLIHGNRDDWCRAVATDTLAQRARRPLQASADTRQLALAFPRQARHFSDIDDVLADLQVSPGGIRGTRV
jgi:dTDP-4-dehydrorhamnose reductase